MNNITADIRKFLTEMFDDEEIEEFCFDYFPRVKDAFSVGMSKNTKILRLLEYCQRRQLVPGLLTALQKTRPDQYKEYLTETSPPSNSGISIIHSKMNSNNEFPQINVTLMNKTERNQVITEVDVVVVGYHPYASIPEPRVLEPIAVWDIELPFSTGRFRYVPISPVLIPPGDAAAIGLRFFVTYEGRFIPPREAGSYELKFVFMGTDNLTAETELYSL